MPRNGESRRATRKEDDGPGRREDADDYALFYQQSPATPPPRFGSPSRPRKSDDDGEELCERVEKLGVGAAASALVQSVAWIALSVAGILVYLDAIPSPETPQTGQKWDDFSTLIANLYFNAHSTFPELPEQGVLTPPVMFKLMIATLAVNAVWLVASSVMLRQVRFGGATSVKATVAAWSASTVAVTVVDVMLGVVTARDLVLLRSWTPPEEYPVDTDLLSLCPALILVLALRGGVLLLANVGCMLSLLLKLRAKRDDDSSGRTSPSSTVRDGPIDAYLYQNDNSGSLGVQNPVFVNDDLGPEPAGHKSWLSFQPAEEKRSHHQGANQQQGQRGKGKAGPQHPRAAGLRREDPDDVSHLSWMEEVDKHVDVRVRSVARPSVPQHHRFGVVEPRGQGGQGGARLPRVRINPNAPQFPSVPPPDYSPPPIRRQPPPPQYGHHQGYDHQGQGQGQGQGRHAAQAQGLATVARGCRRRHRSQSQPLGPVAAPVAPPVAPVLPTRREQAAPTPTPPPCSPPPSPPLLLDDDDANEYPAPPPDAASYRSWRGVLLGGYSPDEEDV